MVDLTIYELENSDCTRYPHPLLGAFNKGAANDR